MIRLTVWFVAILVVQPLRAQDISEHSTFHRLLIFNEHEELLTVKIEGRDLWVTPGWYQDNHSTFQQGLHKLAGTYGLTTTTPSLRGVFTLQMGDDQNLSTRLVYSVVALNTDTVLPDGVDTIRWLKVPEALELISLLHIRCQLEQIVNHPATVWGGSQRMFQENDVNQMSVIEPFYPLFPIAE